MEQRKRSGKYDGKANLLLVNLRGAADAKKFCSEKGISACTSLVGRPSSEYGLKYIPHKVLIDSLELTWDKGAMLYWALGIA